MEIKFVAGGKVLKNVLYIGKNSELEISEKILKTVGNLRLIGETGVGKTTLVYKLAEKLNAVLFETVLTRDTSRWDLVATDVLKQGETQIRKGIILNWLEADQNEPKIKNQPKILYIDGFNYAEPNIISLIESLADFRGNIFIPELNKEYFRTELHYLIISYNPSEKQGYSGTFIENIATLRRFEGLVIDYLPISKEVKLLQRFYPENYNWCRKMVEIANKTRILYKNGELRLPLTTGNLINYAKLKKAGLEDSQILEIILSLFPENERSLVRSLAEEVEASPELLEKLEKEQNS